MSLSTIQHDLILPNSATHEAATDIKYVHQRESTYLYSFCGGGIGNWGIFLCVAFLKTNTMTRDIQLHSQSQ